MEASANSAKTLEEFRRSLRKVLHWAEAYEPSRQHRQAYDADLDEAEALLVNTAARMVEAPSRKPLDARGRRVRRR